jgi:hypothetical protein
VLEHGIVNALVILELIPSRRHLARSADEWESDVGAFMDRHFKATMGRMMKTLRDVTRVDNDLEQRLSEALRSRNWLAHDFFRERAVEFMSAPGRAQMIAEVDRCRDLFLSAAEQLEDTVAPLRRQAGLTDELLAQEYARMTGESKR